MLSVRTLVNANIKQRLTEDADAPYKNKGLHYTSSSNFAPSEKITLNVESLGEPTQSSDLQNNQCVINSTIQLKSAYLKDNASSHMTEARSLMDKAGDAMLEMGYQLITGPEDISDNRFSIIVCRFRRMVGAGDIGNFKFEAK